MQQKKHFSCTKFKTLNKGLNPNNLRDLCKCAQQTGWLKYLKFASPMSFISCLLPYNLLNTLTLSDA